jgi:hypothetical protein
VVAAYHTCSATTHNHTTGIATACNNSILDEDDHLWWALGWVRAFHASRVWLDSIFHVSSVSSLQYMYININTFHFFNFLFFYCYFLFFKNNNYYYHYYYCCYYYYYCYYYYLFLNHPQKPNFIKFILKFLRSYEDNFVCFVFYIIEHKLVSRLVVYFIYVIIYFYKFIHFLIYLFILKLYFPFDGVALTCHSLINSETSFDLLVFS